MWLKVMSVNRRLRSEVLGGLEKEKGDQRKLLAPRLKPWRMVILLGKAVLGHGTGQAGSSSCLHLQHLSSNMQETLWSFTATRTF